MEPISAAILGALLSGIASGSSDVAKKAVKDSYDWLKDSLRRKLGPESKPVEAIEKLEEDPDSAGWREQLQKELAISGADRDPDIVAAAEKLLEAIKAMPGGERYIQTAKGNYIAQAQDSSTASVNVSRKD